MSGTRRVSFSPASAGFSALDLPEGARLPLHLTVQNSPVLFGCRTGLCGTCVAEVRVTAGSIEPPDDDELETLGLALEEVSPHARLLCQIRLTGDITIGAQGEP